MLETSHCKVAIVGAGLAGLGAALTLLKAGHSNILLLEAQNRPGGRLLTLSTENHYLEMGAQWIHDTSSSLYQIAEEHNLVSVIDSEEKAGIYVRSDGSFISYDLVEVVEEVVEQILVKCEQFANLKDDCPESVGSYLEDNFFKYIQHCNDDDYTKTLKIELYNWHVKFQLIDNSCNSLKDLSAKSWGKYELGVDGQKHINLIKGHTALIDVLVKEIPENLIRLENPISKINWKNDNGKVILHCSNGDVICDHVILTSSLGVLKKSLEMFDPNLPSPLVQTISSMGFGSIGKIYLIFKERWWKWTGIQLVWEKDFPLLSDESKWTQWITGFDTIPNAPNILLGWIGGEGVNILESKSEEIVGKQCVEILKLFLKNIDIPYPTKTIRTDWKTNIWTRGTYSYTTTESDKFGYCPSVLSDPVMVNSVPKIILAGEACHSTHFSTSHGAFSSGEEQAKLLMDYL